MYWWRWRWGRSGYQRRDVLGKALGGGGGDVERGEEGWV